MDKVHLPTTEELRAWFTEHLEDILAENIAITQVPAPSWDEHERAVFLEEKFRALGLTEVRIDEVDNVSGIWQGKNDGPIVLLAAHLDTVFPRGTDLTVRREGSRLYAPGIRDNSFGVTSLLWLIRALKHFSIDLPGRFICVATAGEEGLGDLKGMKAAMERHHREVDYVIAIDGGLGGLTTGGITSRRHKITVTAQGGHSYGAFGNTSAIHSIGRMIAAIADLQVPTSPRTTYNVGVVSGGNSVNSIAASAEMLIDMRSEERGALMALEEQLLTAIEAVRERDGVQVVDDLMGDRPGGATPEDHPLVQTILGIQKNLGLEINTHASSTDANVAMGYGIPAVCLGCGHGGDAHRLEEWLESEGIDIGLTQLVQVAAAVMHLPIREK